MMGLHYQLGSDNMDFIFIVALIFMGGMLWWKGMGPSQILFWFAMSVMAITFIISSYSRKKIRGFYHEVVFKKYFPTVDSDISKGVSDGEKLIPNYMLAFAISGVISTSVAAYYEYSDIVMRNGLITRFIALGCFFVIAKILMWVLPKKKKEL